MQHNVNYERVEEAIKFLSEHFKTQPSLQDVAKNVHLSPFHFQRIFSEWAGISPKKFLQYITLQNLKKEIQHTDSLSHLAEKVGLSVPSRVYDLFVNIEAVTPQTYQSKGKGLIIQYGFHPTPFGKCLIANTERGVCTLQFVAGENESKMLDDLRQEWAHATIVSNQNDTSTLIAAIFSPIYQPKAIKLWLKGSDFQIKVWEALLKIPFGSVVSYQHIADFIGCPKACRAVGTAVSHNAIAYLIPCHRVIRREGHIGQYRWGTHRKAALIGWEKSH